MMLSGLSSLYRQLNKLLFMKLSRVLLRESPTPLATVALNSREKLWMLVMVL